MKVMCSSYQHMNDYSENVIHTLLCTSRGFVTKSSIWTCWLVKILHWMDKCVKIAIARATAKRSLETFNTFQQDVAGYPATRRG